MTANTYGRQVVIPLTNKAGLQVIAGDVVVIDTTNSDAFTTSTAGAVTITIGIAQATIASNAAGPVLMSGYAALVNVNASVTRGNYGKTHTVAKQATDAGASRVSGTFCQFLTGGTTPDAMVYPVDLAGAALTNPMSAVGDIIQGTTAGAPAALAAPLAGKVLTGAGVTTPLAYAYPPGYEFDYTEITGAVTVASTTEGTETTVITGGSVTYDGSTTVIIEVFLSRIDVLPSATGRGIIVVLYEDSTTLGRIGLFIPTFVSTENTISTMFLTRRRTPSNASHQYIVKAWKSNASDTVTVNAQAGGSGLSVPCYVRVRKV